ncbi:MAG: hypothetical protein WEB53_08050 [Akkermansiaceae bacterium]
MNSVPHFHEGHGVGDDLAVRARGAEGDGVVSAWAEFISEWRPNRIFRSNNYGRTKV